MKRSLFYFAWRELIRSANLSKSIAANIVLVFLALYFSLTALVIGFNLNIYIEKNFPSQSSITVFNSLIFYYLIFDLIVRIMMQKSPTFGFKPFLIIPIKRKKIANYVLNKSLLSFFNVLPLFIILPFAFKTAINELNFYIFNTWLTSLFILIFINHFLAIYIKWQSSESSFNFYGIFILFIEIFAIIFLKIIDIPAFFGKFFDFIIKNPIAFIILSVILIFLYFLNLKYLWNRFYLDEISQKKENENKYNFSWLNKVGEYGKMLSLEVKMIVRNNRPRGNVLMSLFFIFYGFLFYSKENKDIIETTGIFLAIFMIGIFIMIYGQFFPAWHSRYYPFLMAQNVKMKQILQSAFFLMSAVSLIMFLLSLGYMYFSIKIFYMHLAGMLYNIGVNIFVIFAIGLSSRKSIDLDGSVMFNYQGMGAAQWLMFFPLVVVPIIIFSILNNFFGNFIAYFVIGTIGLVGIILHPFLINYFTKQYLKRKHKMISAYKTT